MATGTGKTYTAFQIIHRLWKAGAKKRILFLADRNALIDQTKRGDFRHFKDKMTVIKHKKIDKSYEIYLALYQGLTNYDEDSDAYRQFSQDFFDLIVIDECHRGSAAEDSAWREILAYFGNATHIGLTATPKETETETISSTDYFGDPIYTYSLKQGIQDGFLAPYKERAANPKPASRSKLKTATMLSPSSQQEWITTNERYWRLKLFINCIDSPRWAT